VSSARLVKDFVGDATTISFFTFEHDNTFMGLEGGMLIIVGM
jgi:hypothetical protein